MLMMRLRVLSIIAAISGLSSLALAHGDELINSGRSYHGLKSSSSWLPREPVVLTATGGELMSGRSLPLNFDWRNVHGRNFATADVNQHIPQYCGACWIHGTVAQINDRIKIMRDAAFPDVMISRQALVNCVPGEKNATAGCFGGDPWMIYNYMKDNKVPDESCSPYKAKNDKCLPWTVCGNCAPPPGFTAAIMAGKNVAEMNFDMEGGCYAIPHFTGYKVSQFGSVNGSEAMMKEIYARGPISCNLNSDDRFMYKYSEVAEQNEGVYLDDAKFNETDHIVEVTGWGETASGLKYWVIRNSWGTYWGEGGWFKLRRGVNQNLIEGDCSWAIPDVEDERLVVEGRILGDYVSGTHMVAPALATGLAQELQNSCSLGRLINCSSAQICGGATIAGSILFMALLLLKRVQSSSPQQPPLLG